MSDQPSLSRGGMSPEGRTNLVSIPEPRLDPQDRKVLCSAVCHRSSMPNPSQDRKSLKQVCAAQRLGELDEILQGHSPYKSEVSYDMTKNPPQLILDSQTDNSPHGWIPGRIGKYWDEGPEHPPFKPGKGAIRRSDVIIVQNPNRPPIQDSIKQVMEMKFLPDPHNREQLEDYAVTAGNKDKTVEMKPSDCDCGQGNQRSKVPVEQAGWVVTIAGGVMFVLTRGRPPYPIILAYRSRGKAHGTATRPGCRVSRATPSTGNSR